MQIKGIIPELKMSEGVARAKFYLKAMKDYPILSINTSSLFNGNIHLLEMARDMYPKKYLIRKDFIMIPRQIEESKIAGADAVLLIKDFLSLEQYIVLTNACAKLGIDFITEVTGCDMVIGSKVLVNTRDLNTGTFYSERAKNICRFYKKNIKNVNVIYASGESSDKVVKKGIADAVLIGTAFMRDTNGITNLLCALFCTCGVHT
jgi:indole-3-glycerol phosphate synthase